MFDGIHFKTIWGSLCHIFLSGNKIHMLWAGGILLLMLILAILHHRWRDSYGRQMLIWRLLCLLPAAAAGAHYYLYLRGLPAEAIMMFAPLYAAAVFALIPVPFAKVQRGFGFVCFLTGLLSVLSLSYFTLSSPHLYNYTDKSFVESYHAFVDTMDKTYVLKDWKEADFKELEKKYLPLVEEADKTGDKAKFASAVEGFCNELHDGHVEVESSDEKGAVTIGDYGFGMVKLDDDTVIAVCTAKEANDLGIKDGTVMTKWDGKPILEAAEEVEDMGIPVKSNFDKMAVMKLACADRIMVDVSFLDDNGEEQTVSIYNLIDKAEDLKEHHAFKDTLDAFSGITFIDENEDIEKLNFSTKMLDKKCGYIQVLAEGTESNIHDIAGYLNGDHKWAREMFRKKLRGLKDDGMEYLVIDLRNNMGGNDEVGFALVDLLTDEPMFGLNIGIRSGKEYKPLSDHGIKGDGEFKDLKVIALTNFNCGSAGDSLAEALGKLPNVTLAGITDPAGCNQEVGGMVVLSGGDIVVHYPTGLVLNEKNEVNIDIKADRISRDPVEKRIPLDRDAAMKLFRDKEDYELDWAVKQLEG
ncbi:S41 family peptidase [Ruminococcus sp.]|uniref:S41 family peptidase n=1 Tax=Ruminococcus sp. TaxID=41978 RepID=UPI002600F6A6|nr:S41 family peptidase [Ruminococcus sp.]MBQ8967150.1 hypothetical protein [Ruminococcus sp.]